MGYDKLMKKTKTKAKPKAEESKGKPAGIAEKVICLLDIINKIDQGLHPSPASLAKDFQISRRSVHRYLEIINFIIPIEYDKQYKGYRFTSKSTLKKLSINEHEMSLLLILGDAVSHMGEELQEHYHGLLGKFLSASKGETLKKNDLPFLINISDMDDSTNLKKNFPIISNAIINRNSVDIKYHAVHSDEISERRVDPYGLIFSDGNWLMVGHCHLDDDIRKFDLSRILELKKSWLKFKQGDFDLKQYADERWGLYDGEKTEVKVRFSKEVAHLITRKKKWHPSEKRVVLPSGEVELTLTVEGTEKLKRWLYTWIPNVTVLEPKWLRKEIKTEINKMMRGLS